MTKDRTRPGKVEDAALEWRTKNLKRHNYNNIVAPVQLQRSSGLRHISEFLLIAVLTTPLVKIEIKRERYKAAA